MCLGEVNSSTDHDTRVTQCYVDDDDDYFFFFFFGRLAAQLSTFHARVMVTTYTATNTILQSLARRPVCACHARAIHSRVCALGKDYCHTTHTQHTRAHRHTIARHFYTHIPILSRTDIHASSSFLPLSPVFLHSPS